MCVNIRQTTGPLRNSAVVMCSPTVLSVPSRRYSNAQFISTDNSNYTPSPFNNNIVVLVMTFVLIISLFHCSVIKQLTPT